MTSGSNSFNAIQDVAYNLNFGKVAFLSDTNFVIAVLDSVSASVLGFYTLSISFRTNPYLLYNILVFDSNDNFLIHMTSGSHHFHLV